MHVKYFYYFIFPMKFEISKKILTIIISSVLGIMLLWGILSVVGHGKYERNDFWRGFEWMGFWNTSCGNHFAQWENKADMMSGIENIITTKDYAAFQTLFSGTRMANMINTPEKFTTRVDLQTTMKKVQTLQTQLWSSNDDSFPMMFNNQQCGKEGKNFGRQMERCNMMQRR